MGYKGYIKWVEEFDGDESTGEYGILGNSVDEVYEQLMLIHEEDSKNLGSSRVEEISIRFTRKD